LLPVVARTPTLPDVAACIQSGEGENAEGRPRRTGRRLFGSTGGISQ
jgi:hypothetical protein